MTKCPQCDEELDDKYGYCTDWGDYEEHFCMNCEKSVRIYKEGEHRLKSRESVS